MNTTVIRELMCLGAEYANAKFEVIETEVGVTSAKVTFSIPINLYGQEHSLKVYYSYHTNPKTETLDVTFVNETENKQKNVYLLKRLVGVQNERIWKIAKQVCEDYKKHYNVSLKQKKE